MTALVTGDKLLDILRRSGLVAAARLAPFAARPDLVADASALAAALIAAGLLTPFQAKLLLAGKYRGLMLGSYKILDQIGRGGMGTVYLAEHTSLKRKVAVKVLAGQQATTDEGTSQFYREAQAAAALDHPNIVKVYDVGRFGTVHFIAMEYVEGRTLAQLLEAGPVPFDAAADYAAQAAAGLQAAGDRGFVHRDIKPENLIVDRAGTLKILDLGLAHAVNDAAGSDVTSVHGTPDYIAPEQALNAPVDIRTDIYSLGVTLYALLTGRPPFAGTTSQKLLQHQLNAAPPFGDLPTPPPADLERVVAKMMAKRPADRYQQPSDVIEALAPWLTQSALAATQTWSSSATLSRSSVSVLALPEPPLPGGWLLPAAGVVLAGLVVACVATAVVLLG